MEKKLLDDAKLWFLENYGKSNDEVGYRYVQIWYKPVIFNRKLPTVIFARTKEIGEAFVKEQKMIIRSFKYFMIMASMVPLAFVVLFGLQRIELLCLLVVFCFGFALYNLWQYVKCKKMENIHNWDIAHYVAQ